MIPAISLAYNGWDKYCQLLEEAIAPLTADELSWQAAPNLWSIRMLASHMVAARGWWFNSWLGQGAEELANYADYDEGAESQTRGTGTVLAALRRTRAIMADNLGRWTESDLDQAFRPPSPQRERGRRAETLGWIVWHVMEHDVHHGGEISLTLGVHGREGLDP